MNGRSVVATIGVLASLGGILYLSWSMLLSPSSMPGVPLMVANELRVDNIKLFGGSLLLGAVFASSVSCLLSCKKRAADAAE